MARVLVEQIGMAVGWAGVRADIERHGISQWSHAGGRLGASGIAAVLYWRPA